MTSASAMPAATVASTHPPMKGTLGQTPFPRILRHIADELLTGSLFLVSGQTKKVVLFEHGLPIFVRSNLVSECLGQILVSDGLISVKQCEQTLETMRRTGKQQGRLLVEMGLISEGNLRYGLETQIRHKLFDIFAWEDGRYQFKEERHHHDLGVQLHMSSAAVIVAGILERFSPEQAASKLSALNDRYPRRLGNEPLDLELQVFERHFLDSLDGSRSIQNLLDASHPAQLPMPGVLLFALIEAGLCSVDREPTSTQASSEPLPPDPTLTPDEHLMPAFDTTNALTEFEDTPLPGFLPRPANADNAAEALLFDDNAKSLIDETLSDADGSAVGGGYDEEILQLGDDELEVIEESAHTDFSPRQPQRDGQTGDPLGAAQLINPDDKDGLDQIDIEIDKLTDIGIDIEGGLSGNKTTPIHPGDGAAHFEKGRLAVNNGDWKNAIEELEMAYECSIDVAELHAMLAYARFKFSGEDSALAEHALELLDYAEDMEPDLGIIHSYRAAVHFAEGNRDRAQQSAERALAINPLNELAKSIQDKLNAKAAK